MADINTAGLAPANLSAAQLAELNRLQQTLNTDKDSWQQIYLLAVTRQNA